MQPVKQAELARAPERPRVDRAGLRRGERTLAIALAVPTLAIVLGLTVYPVLYALWISLHRYDLIRSRGHMPFIGLANYIDIVSSGYFWDSSWRTLYFTLVSLAVQVVLGLAVALVLNEDFRGRSVVRALILIPWAIPTIVNGVLWQWIYNANYGALNGLLLQLGLIHEPVLWTGEAIRALNMVIIADTWKMLPFYALMFLAALQTVPNELYESAHIDGASMWGRFLNVTFPFLKPMLLVVLVLRTMQTFRVFDIIYVLTQGGPGGGTRVIAFFAYEASFLNLNFGYGAALSFVIAAIIFGMALVYIRLLRSEEMY